MTRITCLDNLALIPGTGRSFLTAFKLAASCFRESEMKRQEREAASLTAILFAAIFNVHHAIYFLTSTNAINTAKLVKWAGYVGKDRGKKPSGKH